MAGKVLVVARADDYLCTRSSQPSEEIARSSDVLSEIYSDILSGAVLHRPSRNR